MRAICSIFEVSVEDINLNSSREIGRLTKMRVFGIFMRVRSEDGFGVVWRMIRGFLKFDRGGAPFVMIAASGCYFG